MINPSRLQLRASERRLRRTHSSIAIPNLASIYALICGIVLVLLFLLVLYSVGFAQTSSIPLLGAAVADTADNRGSTTTETMQQSFGLTNVTAAKTMPGTLTQYLATWDGLQRMYYVYVPKVVAATPSIVVFLHASYAKPAVPLYELPPWETIANQYGIVILLPISTWDPNIDTWRWDCDGCESGFAVPPDDSGFIRSAIMATQAQYNVKPSQTFVAGMSSGAYMAQRVGMEQNDVIAAIAPVSGAQYLQPLKTIFNPPLVGNPVSVYRLNGDLDTVVPYCGGTKGFWAKVKAYSPSVDSDVDFWAGEDANLCTSASESQPLCTDGVPTEDVNGQDETGCKGEAEVIFEREIGVGHTWIPGTEAKLWAFFQTHSR
jgi:poly(3-hydroxybutyrate) depolymerase